MPHCVTFTAALYPQVATKKKIHLKEKDYFSDITTPHYQPCLGDTKFQILNKYLHDTNNV